MAGAIDQVNLICLQGHSFMHLENIIYAIPGEEPMRRQFINLTKLAQRFAQIPRCATLIIFDGMLTKVKEDQVLAGYSP